MIWLLVLATFTCTIQGQDEPKILSDTKYISGFPDQFYSLHVITNTGVNFKYQWEHNGNRIDSNYTLAFNGETTTSLRPDRRDFSDDLTNLVYQGTYQFFMETPVGTIAGHKLKVEFTYLGKFSERKPSDIRKVVVGQAAFINCPKHTPGNNVVYKWGKISPFSGIRFINAGNNYIVLDNGSLFFSHLKKKDLGYINDFRIACMMEANVGKENRFSFSHVVKLSNISQNWTKFGPEIVTKLPIKVFTVDETIFLKCAATGNPVPTYTWKKIDSEGNEKPIVDGEDNIVFVDGDSRILEIMSTKKSHAGKYICTATIGEKSDSVEGELTYQEKPSWTSDDIKSVKPSIYSSHSWQCVATGSPNPNYNWYKNGKQIINSSNFQIDEGKITFPKLEKVDSGMYQCVAANDIGNIYQTAHLHVQAMKPTFEENRAMITLLQNNPGTINCSAKAAPVAKNTWMMNDTVINTDLPRYELVNNQDLIIKNVKKADIGNYTCIAKNLYGKDSKTIQIEVIGEIKFVQAPVDINITRTENIMLYCEAIRVQNIVVQYKWRFNNKELDTHDAKIIWSLDSHALIILEAEVKHGGVYECIAFIDMPEYLEKKRSATVIVRGPPEEIDKLKVEGGCDDLQAKLTWSTVYRHFDPIKYFIIEWRTSFDPYKWHNYTSRVPAHRRKKVVKNLSPYALYSFRVLAVNAIGTSDNTYNTDFIDCKTPARATTKCPTPTGHPGKKNELTIRWKKMELIDQNGPKFHYQFEYKKRGGSTWQNKTLNATAEKFDIPNAGYYQLWDFRIRGVNEAGRGSVCSGNAYSSENNICQLCNCYPHTLQGTTVVCSHRRLVEMPAFPTQYRDATIQSYTVDYNEIKTVSKESLQQFPNLEYLDLSVNKISIIPEDVFKNNPNIEGLILRENNISIIPVDVFKNNPNIQRLDLSGNKISIIPVDVFKNNPNIQRLDLSYNSISSIPEDVFKNNPNIQRLMLHHNKMSLIPVDVFKNNPNIQDLDLSWNKIYFIHVDVFNNNPNIKRLDLRYNKISFIDEDVFNNNPNIEKLYLSHNKISLIPVDVFRNNPNIEFLYLGYNKISLIPVDVFSNNPNIKILILDHNKISLIPVDVFKYNPNIRSLSLRQNTMWELPVQLFMNIPNLRDLKSSSLIDCCNAYRISGSLRWCNGGLPPFKKCGVKLIARNQTSRKRISMGIVEVYDDGKWKIICDKNWTKGDADVTCIDLGFIGAIEPSLLPFDVQENKTALSYDYMCTGNEDYLINCPRTMARSSSCSHAANVRCKDEGNLLCKICKCTSTYVDCSRRKLEYMPWTNSTFLGNITRFNISNNKLKNVSGELLQSFSNLQYMDLSNNRLEELPKTVFTASSRLKQLNLCKNNIKSLDTKFLENLTNLEKLDISANSALKIQSWKFLLKMKNLKELKTSTSSQCCYVRHERPDIKCIAPKDYIISNCDSVTKSKKAQPMVWIIIVVLAAGGGITLVTKNNI